MNRYCKTFLLGMSGILILAHTLPVFADSMLVPRLGYSPLLPKRIYLELSEQPNIKGQKNEKTPETESEAEKESKKAFWKVWQSQIDAEALKRGEEAAAEVRKKALKDEKSMTKEERRKLAESERVARNKAITDYKLEAFKNTPIGGVFYLYDLKQQRLQFKEPSKIQSVQGDTPVTPFYVEFRETPAEGVFDLAVVGSGHKSDAPIYVSDAVYWDALQPVLQDMNKAHCPPDNGTFRILQQCYNLNVVNPLAEVTPEGPKPQLVTGGWYTQNDNQNLIKSTVDIANLSQMLLQTYLINPKSFKYLGLVGEHYTQSKYPDILDEANWGLQYLLTSQQPDGSFPQGVRRQSEGGVTRYTLVPAPSTEATARAVMTLATASLAFQKEDLSMSVRFLRAAEKGWSYLVAHAAQTEPEWMYLATTPMSQASSDMLYAKAYDTVKSHVSSLSAFDSLLLGSMTKGTGLSPAESTTGDVWALLSQARQGESGAIQSLAAWVNNLYGYDKISFVREGKYEVASALTDPLGWMAGKTGIAATKMGQKFADSNIMRLDAKISTDSLKALEETETKARQRMRKGYQKLTFNSLLERTQLAYALTLLNQQVAPIRDKQQEEQRDLRDRFDEPDIKKGHWPKPL